MKRIKRILFLAILVLTLQIGIGTNVYAAEGNLIIALSESNVSVGNTVQVTLSAVGSAGEKAVADMEFSYDENVFSFVSCNADNYSGGSGGKVSVSGTKVVITLKAINQGSARVVVTGSNGRTKDSGESLEKMEAAGATIQAASGENSENSTGNSEGVKSNDNSLSSLSLSVGELVPEFSYSVTEYTAVVPYEVSGIEVNAQTNHGKAQIESISGNSDLQVGENTIKVIIAAEDGSKAVYTVLLTREGEGQSSQNTTSDMNQIPQEQMELESLIDPTVIEEYESRIALWEKEYGKLKEKYEVEKSNSKKTMAILVFIIIVLVIVCINLLLCRKNKNGKKDKKREVVKKEKNTGSSFKTVGDVENDWLDDDVWQEQEVEQKKSVRVRKKTKKQDMEIIDFDDF